jgi:hypothetical protein
VVRLSKNGGGQEAVVQACKAELDVQMKDRDMRGALAAFRLDERLSGLRPRRYIRTPDGFRPLD